MQLEFINPNTLCPTFGWTHVVSARQPPASTLVGVSALVGPDWLIEIEAVAVVAQ